MLDGGKDTMLLVELVFSISSKEVIFLIFKELIFLEKIFFKNFNQPNMGKIGRHLTEHTFCLGPEDSKILPS